jgi:hypothetical protein
MDIAYFRHLRWRIGAVVLWVVGSRVISILLPRFGPYPQARLRIRHPIATIARMGLSFLAYVCCMNFIQREGRSARGAHPN